MAAHAELSASGSATWLNCAGSVEAQRQYGRTSSRFADEGTAAHTLAEICFGKFYQLTILRRSSCVAF